MTSDNFPDIKNIDEIRVNYSNFIRKKYLSKGGLLKNPFYLQFRYNSQAIPAVSHKLSDKLISERDLHNDMKVPQNLQIFEKITNIKTYQTNSTNIIPGFILINSMNKMPNALDDFSQCLKHESNINDLHAIPISQTSVGIAKCTDSFYLVMYTFAKSDYKEVSSGYNNLVKSMRLAYVQYSNDAGVNAFDINIFMLLALCCQILCGSIRYANAILELLNVFLRYQK